MRRADRWLLANWPALRSTPRPLVVDLGFGASPVTTYDLAVRLRRINPAVRVVGLDIDPARVATAQSAPTDLPVEFAVGGFELAGLRPDVVRAFNVLRQYPAAEVPTWWAEMTARLAPGGFVIDGTCDEAGRLASWIRLTEAGPQSLTLAVELSGSPGLVAARLPKILISRNVHGEPIHDLLRALDDGWARLAWRSVFGPRQRFAAVVEEVRAAGWPIADSPVRWRRGEVTVAWTAIAPGLSIG
ncbi:MAG: class I SAM-dependent methyltransferase [Frankiaceae bacterium]|nr:class I SAM-dependent methyltransferase [Frankiaceae bacterium]